MHPAHVPLESESQSTLVDGLGDGGPCGRLLGNHHHVWIPLADDRVGMLEKLDGLEILVTSVHVGDPVLGSAARIVEV